jgi:DNA-binding NarL/FixJ family response regulator
VVGDASDGAEFLNKIEDVDVDIVLMDIAMPKIDGIEATTEVMEKYPDLKVIALSMFGDEEYYYKMIQAGACGFVLKESGSNDLQEAIKEVIKGNNYFSTQLLRNIIFSLGEKKQTITEITDGLISLTKRESEILQLICNGLSTAEIATKLHISNRTVEGHKANLLSKTGSKSSVNLVMFAIRNKLVNI